MSIQDPISDMLTIIRNGLKAKKEAVVTNHSKLKCDVLDVLIEEGYLKKYEVTELRKGIKVINISLKYYAGEPIIQMIKRISKPSLRKYFSADSIPSVLDGRGISILSTNKGVMTDFAAKQARVGGELICQVE